MRFEEFGRLDGLRDGKEMGQLEGHRLGIEKGYEFGKEIGFYTGFSEQWLQIVAANSKKYSPKLEKHLQSMLVLCNSFSCENQLNEDPHGLMRQLRGKFRAAQIMLKVKQNYKLDNESLSF
jgi:plasmid maintenance system killer protein